VREQSESDPRIVLKTVGLRSLATERRIKPRGPREQLGLAAASADGREVADERRGRRHERAEIADGSRRPENRTGNGDAPRGEPKRYKRRRGHEPSGAKGKEKTRPSPAITHVRRKSRKS